MRDPREPRYSIRSAESTEMMGAPANATVYAMQYPDMAPPPLPMLAFGLVSQNVGKGRLLGGGDSENTDSIISSSSINFISLFSIVIVFNEHGCDSSFSPSLNAIAGFRSSFTFARGGDVSFLAPVNTFPFLFAFCRLDLTDAAGIEARIILLGGGSVVDLGKGRRGGCGS